MYSQSDSSCYKLLACMHNDATIAKDLNGLRGGRIGAEIEQIGIHPHRFQRRQIRQRVHIHQPIYLQTQLAKFGQ